MLQLSKTLRTIQVRPAIPARAARRALARGTATILLCLYALLAPAMVLAAPPARAEPRPIAAPHAQGQTVARWVDGFSGSNTMPNPNGDGTIPSNCSRVVTADDPDTNENEESYVYHSCATLTYALSIANPGDIIRVAGGKFGIFGWEQIQYGESPTIGKDVTIIGGYITGFGAQDDPPRFDGFEPIFTGITINGVQILAFIPPQVSTESPMNVRLESIQIGANGINIQSLQSGFFYPKAVDVTLEDMTVSGATGDGGINFTGLNGGISKLTINKSLISGNSGSTGGGIYAGANTVLNIGEGTMIQYNTATGNGGGIGTGGTLTLTVSSGVTVTNNSATNGNGGGIYAGAGGVNIGSGATIQFNSAGNGGGIYLNGGTNTVSGATVRGNSASGGNGGGIYANSGTPTLQNLVVSENSAANGGGVYLNGVTGGTLSASDIMSNSAASSGGGYYLNGGVDFIANSLKVHFNQATAAHGGGGYVTNANNTSKRITIQGNDFTGNRADDGNSGTPNNGGGLYIFSSAPTLQGNSYTANYANAGGGLYLEQSGNTNAGSDTFTENTANYGGGVALINNNGAKFTAPDLIGNVATVNGGGIYASNNALITIGSPTIQANTATGNNAAGAGLYAINSTLTFTNSAFFEGNIATGNGGGGYAGTNALLNFQTLDLQNNQATNGGGFYTENGGRVVATSASSFIGNKATGTGGALYLKGTGGTVSTVSDLFAQNNEAASGGALYAEGVNLTIGNANLTGNRTESGNGGGAAIITSTVVITNPAIFLDNEAAGSGGALYATSSNITFQKSALFSGNKATGGDGGGVYLSGTLGNSATFSATTFLENLAQGNGGAFYADSVTVTLAPTTKLESNIAQTGHGGGFYLSGAPLTLTGITLKSNRTFQSGGGGYFTGSSLTLTGNILDDNGAQTMNGGGIAAVDATAVIISNTLFTKNVGAADGGGIYVSNSPLTLHGNSFFDTNSATSGRGGALFVNGGSATLNALSFTKNSAGSGGGGIYANTGAFTLQNSLFSENNGGTTSGAGGGLYLQATNAGLVATTFDKNLAQSGAGLYLADTPNATLTAVQFTENNSSGPGGGIYFDTSTATVDKSTLRGNGASGEGGAIYALFSAVDVVNTLIAANRVNTLGHYAAGVFLSNTTFNATHITVANNTHQQLQGSGHAFYAAPPLSPPGSEPARSTLTLVNTIVSGQAVGVNLLAGNNAIFDAVLWNNEHFNWTGDGNFTVTRSRRGNPSFVSVATNDYRLRRDSAAFDQGTITTVTSDRDGIARTQGLAPDLGAYEHRYAAGLYLFAGVSTPFVNVGDTLTFNLRVRNQSDSSAQNVVLRATLPAQLPSPSISQGACQGIFCEANLGTLAPGADIQITINVGVGGTPLGNGLLTLLTNITLQTGNFSTSDTSVPAVAYLQNCRAELNGSIHNTVQGAMDAASNGQTIRISGVCGNMHQNGGPGQLLTINKNVTLQGGWSSDFTTLNATQFPTYLDAGALGRVVYINGDYSPTLENLILRNGNASALGGGPVGKDAGGGVYINGGAPSFINVDIANSHSPDLGGGVYLATPNPVNFAGGFVRNNSSGERGGGLYINQSAPILTGVNIAGNSARGGGGVYLYRSAAQFIDNAPVGSAPTCRIDSNTSSVMPNYVPGPGAGGLPVLWLAPGGGGGIVFDESAAIVRGCSVHGNSGRVGGGAYIHNSAALIENTLFTSNRAQQPVPTAVLIGPGGVRDGDGGGLVIDNQDPAAITLRGLLLGSNQGVRGSGLLTRFGRGGTLTLPHFTINSNLGGSAVVALGESNLAFVNTIVAFNTGGAAIFAQGGINNEAASITLDHTLFHPPTQTKTGSSGGSVTSNVEFTGDPAFKNDGYHLKRISAAYGVGTNTTSFADRDGNARPVGATVELGADEYATAVTVRYVAVGGNGGAPCTDYRAPCPSLQTALDASGDGDVIKMAGVGQDGVTYSSVRNDGGRIHHALVQKSVTIEGAYFPRTDTNTVTDGLYTLHDWEDPHPNETATVIDVTDQGRVFFITGNVTPTFSYLTLRRGNATALSDGPPGKSGGAGGGVYVDGASPIFKNVIVEESRAHFGSGFYLRNAGGSYTGVTVLGNGTGVSNAQGGGFYIQGGAPTLQATTIQANVAVTGAGVYLDNSTATLAQNTIQSNGDATTLDGGGVYLVAGSSTLITNTVANNRAQHGGGLHLQNSNATLRGNSIQNNRAGSSPSPSNQTDALGGGLYVVGGAPLITLNTLSSNQAMHTATAYGGGLYVAQTGMTLSGNTFNANQAHRGGGIYFAGTTNITVQGNTLASNVAQAPSDELRASGGGLYLATTTITLTANTLRQNNAPFGAGLYVLGAGQNQITANTLITNTATKDGGGIYLDGSDAALANNTLQSNRTTGGARRRDLCAQRSSHAHRQHLPQQPGRT